MHSWVWIETNACSYWKCTNCDHEWHQRKKPSPHYKFWYGNIPFQKIHMSCSEAVAKNVMES